LPKISPSSESSESREEGRITIWDNGIYSPKTFETTSVNPKVDGAPIKRLGSRPLKESTKQITSPTKSGHAPPSNESRKNY